MNAKELTSRRGFLSSVLALLASWATPGLGRATNAVFAPPASPAPLPLAPPPLRTEVELTELAALATCCWKLMMMHAPAKDKKRLWDDYPWIVLPQRAEGCHALCKHVPDDDHRRYVLFNRKTLLAGPTLRNSNEAGKWWRKWKARNETAAPLV
jgi:hypothetical protein